jgi:hypothetical protein
MFARGVIPGRARIIASEGDERNALIAFRDGGLRAERTQDEATGGEALSSR